MLSITEQAAAKMENPKTVKSLLAAHVNPPPAPSTGVKTTTVTVSLKGLVPSAAAKQETKKETQPVEVIDLDDDEGEDHQNKPKTPSTGNDVIVKDSGKPDGDTVVIDEHVDEKEKDSVSESASKDVPQDGDSSAKTESESPASKAETKIDNDSTDKAESTTEKGETENADEEEYLSAEENVSKEKEDKDVVMETSVGKSDAEDSGESEIKADDKQDSSLNDSVINEESKQTDSPVAEIKSSDAPMEEDAQ